MSIYDMILFGSLNFFYEMAIPQFLLMRRQKFRPYFFARLFIVIALSAALYFVPNYYIGLFGISYLLVFALLLIVGMFFFRVHFFDVLFYTVAAFAVQHMVWDILFIGYDVIGGFVEMRRPLALVLYFGVYALFFLFFYLFFPVSSEAGGDARGRGFELAVAAITLIFTYVLSSLVPEYGGWDILYRCYALICCALVLGVQFGIFERKKLKEKNRARSHQPRLRMEQRARV